MALLACSTPTVDSHLARQSYTDVTLNDEHEEQQRSSTHNTLGCSLVTQAVCRFASPLYLDNATLCRGILAFSVPLFGQGLSKLTTDTTHLQTIRLGFLSLDRGINVMTREKLDKWDFYALGRAIP